MVVGQQNAYGHGLPSTGDSKSITWRNSRVQEYSYLPVAGDRS